MDERQKSIRRTLYRIAYEKNVSHIGSSLSCLDMIDQIFRKFYDNWPDVEFILSKGHGVMALYSVLYEIGVLEESDIEEMFEKGSKFIGHVPHIPDKLMRVPTGSLGHGLSIACGMALANKDKKIICMIGDGETNEGSIWEAVAFANRYIGDNLSIIVDCNGTQGYDKTSDVFDESLSMLANKFRAFGLEVITSDDPENIVNVIDEAAYNEKIKKPLVYFLESSKELDDHYKKLDEESYKKLIEELK